MVNLLNFLVPINILKNFKSFLLYYKTFNFFLLKKDFLSIIFYQSFDFLFLFSIKIEKFFIRQFYIFFIVFLG